jgi:hypothetical protein
MYRPALLFRTPKRYLSGKVARRIPPRLAVRLVLNRAVRMHAANVLIRIPQCSVGNAGSSLYSTLDMTASNKTGTLPARPHRLTSLEQVDGHSTISCRRAIRGSTFDIPNGAPSRSCLNFAEFTNLTSVFGLASRLPSLNARTTNTSWNKDAAEKAIG